MIASEIKILYPNHPQWNSFVASHPEASIFHLPKWIELLTTCYGYKAELLTMQDVSGKIIAALPLMQVNSWLTGKRMVSVPFSDFCKPLVSQTASINQLVQALQTWQLEKRVREIRIHWPLLESPGIYKGAVFARHITQLEPDANNLFKQFSKTQVQKNIHVAERKGVEIRLSHQWRDVELFYGLHLKTRRRLGTPIQPFRFFRLFWERLISKGDGFVLLAYIENQLLAGAIFLISHNALVFKYGASNPEGWGYRPNNLLFWHAICWGCEHGYLFFDWGRTDLHTQGLRKFKLGWNSEEQILHYSILSKKTPKNMADGKLASIVASIIRRSPTWVGRYIGETLYSHFG